MKKVFILFFLFIFDIHMGMFCLSEDLPCGSVAYGMRRNGEVSKVHRTPSRKLKQRDFTQRDFTLHDVPCDVFAELFEHFPNPEDLICIMLASKTCKYCIDHFLRLKKTIDDSYVLHINMWWYHKKNDNYFDENFDKMLRFL